jgi:hypothetical protein
MGGSRGHQRRWMWAAVVGDGLSCELLAVEGDGSEVDLTQKLAIFLVAESGKGLILLFVGRRWIPTHIKLLRGHSCS